MSATNRAKLIGKLQTALKKHYTPVSPGTRPLLEHILYASLLQDATYAMADEGIAKCEQEFYDWNEVRVTTVTELSQVLSNVPEPVKAAARLKGNLLEIFEEFFTFDIDHLKKENLGKAVAKFEKMSQMTPFVLSYAVQNGLGGHSIPVDYAAMVVMLSTGIVDQSEAADGKVPGLERAIPKTKGAEFGSLLHQCGVDLLLDPNHKTARAVLEATEKGSADRLDQWLETKEAAKKRVRRRKTSERAAAIKQAEIDDAEAAKTPAKTPAESAKGGKAKTKSAGKSKSAKPSGPAKPKTAPPVAKSPKADAGDDQSGLKTPKKSAKSPKTAAGDSGDQTPKAEPKKPAAAKKTAAKKTATKKAAPKKKSPVKKSTAKKASKTTATKKATGAATKSSASKSDNRKLTKKKPR